MHNRLFNPVAGRLIVVNLIKEIRAITREYLVSQFNWVFETSKYPQNLRVVIDDVASWYDNASGFFESLSCTWPFGGPADRINDLKQLFTVAIDIEDFLQNLNVELDKLKDCVSDREKFKSQQSIVLEKKRALINLIAIHYATLFRQVNMRKGLDFVFSDDRKVVEDYHHHLCEAAELKLSPQKGLFCRHFLYEDQKGTKNKYPVSGLLDYYSGTNALAENLIRRVFGYHPETHHVYIDQEDQYRHIYGYFDKNNQYDLAKISAVVTCDIDMEFTACERQLAAVEQVIHAKVEPVRAENFRLTTELATKEHALSAVDSKLKMVEEERDNAQQMAASMADRQLAERTSATNAVLSQLTNASEDTSHLRSRRMK